MERAHIEEVDGDRVHPDAVIFRFGYCLTAHTAQGGEWPRVFIDQNELECYAAMMWHREMPEGASKWAYTAMTRAREQLVFVKNVQFI